MRKHNLIKATKILFIAAITLLLNAQFTRAQTQPWTTNGTNINNTNSGNVGIGTSNPSTQLEINKSQNAGTALTIDNSYTGAGNGAYQSIWFRQGGANRFVLASFNDGTMFEKQVQLWNYVNSPMLFATNNTERLRITGAGNVGIGTANPIYKLDVQSVGTNAAIRSVNESTGPRGLVSEQYTNNIAGALFEGVKSRGTFASPSAVVNGDFGGFFTAKWYDGTSFVPSGAIGFQVDGAVSGGVVPTRLLFVTSTTSAEGATAYGQERMTILSGGNVGIGTSNPAKKLHVFGSNSQLMVDRSANTVGNYALVNFATNGVQKFFIGMNADSDPNVDKLSFFDAAVSATVPVMTFTGGNVGIGKANPAFKLDVQGGSVNASGGLCINGDCKTSWSQLATSQWTTGTGGAISYAGGNVGLGTNVPTNLLHINSVAAPSSSQFRLSANNAGSLSGLTYSPDNVAIGFDVDWSNSAGWVARHTTLATLYKNAGKLSVLGAKGATVGSPITAWTTMTTIDLATGNFGIGVDSPTEKLQVSGNISVTGTGNITAAGTISGGTIKATYQDVAEWVPSSEKLSSGTVVVLDTTKSNQVLASTQSYDTRIAGVISSQPGITLGEQADNKVLVATTGRVRVKVDATRAPIQIGDLLVTSDIPGTAMKSIPVDFAGRKIHMPGTIVGKALEPLEKGTGEILVLLSLQ